jgi:hypothetical protein
VNTADQFIFSNNDDIERYIQNFTATNTYRRNLLRNTMTTRYGTSLTCNFNPISYPTSTHPFNGVVMYLWVINPSHEPQNLEINFCTDKTCAQTYSLINGLNQTSYSYYAPASMHIEIIYYQITTTSTNPNFNLDWNNYKQSPNVNKFILII